MRCHTEECDTYLMTKEIIAINSEANVRISRKAVDSVKGKFTKSHLGRVNRSLSQLIKIQAAIHCGGVHCDEEEEKSKV